MNEICDLPLDRLARLLRRGEASPSEAVEAYLARIEALDGALNAFIEVTAEQARAAARDSERRTANIYHFIYVTPAQLAGALSRGLRETTYSFRRLSAAEATRLRPQRLRIHGVRSGETAARIAARVPFEDHHLRRFLVLNGLDRDQSFPTGYRVKTVIE